jgi:hypothetical protein
MIRWRSGRWMPRPNWTTGAVAVVGDGGGGKATRRLVVIRRHVWVMLVAITSGSVGIRFSGLMAGGRINGLR